jgi:methylmalonyl-CoA mutase N-terminal domain/subunit
VRHAAALSNVERACVENRNVIPVLIDAVDDGVTLGEVSDIYRKVFGVYSDPGML